MVPAHPMTPTPPAPATSTTYAPSFSVKQALVNAGATPQEATTLTAVSGAESGFGKSPVSPQNKDGSRDYGYFQINNHAWPQFGGAAVANKPLPDQAADALHIYRTQGPGAWTTYKTGAYKSYLGKDATGPGAAAPPGTTLNTPPPAASIANALTGANSQGLSPIQQAQKDFGGEGGQPLPPAPAPQLGMPNMHNQQVEAQAPQLMTALRTASAQPLSWGSQPFGSTAGPRGGAPPQTMANFGGQLIPMPGTTLNSNAGLYG